MHGAAFVSVAGLCFEAAFWDRHMQLMVFPLFAALGLAASIWLYRYHRVIHGTPTSAIGHATPGYVELVGKAAMLPGTPLLTPEGTPCCWYSHWDASRVTWFGSKYRQSTEPFLLVDETGVCAVLPEGAGDFVVPHEASWGGERRGHARVLLAGDPLYATGELTRTQDARGPMARLSHVDVKGLMALVRRGDFAALQRETPRRETPDPAAAEMLVLHKPQRSRPFWLASVAPDELGPNVRFGAWLSLFFFVYFAAGFVWVIMRYALV